MAIAHSDLSNFPHPNLRNVQFLFLPNPSTTKNNLPTTTNLPGRGILEESSHPHQFQLHKHPHKHPGRTLWLGVHLI